MAVVVDLIFIQMLRYRTSPKTHALQADMTEQERKQRHTEVTYSHSQNKLVATGKNIEASEVHWAFLPPSYTKHHIEKKTYAIFK